MPLNALILINSLVGLASEFESFNKSKTKLSKGLRDHLKTESSGSPLTPEQTEQIDSMIKDLPSLFKQSLQLIIEYIARIVKEPIGLSENARKVISTGASAAFWEGNTSDFEGKLKGWEVSMSVIGIQTKCEKLIKKL